MKRFHDFFMRYVPFLVMAIIITTIIGVYEMLTVNNPFMLYVTLTLEMGIVAYCVLNIIVEQGRRLYQLIRFRLTANINY